MGQGRAMMSQNDYDQSQCTKSSTQHVGVHIRHLLVQALTVLPRLTINFLKTACMYHDPRSSAFRCWQDGVHARASMVPYLAVLKVEAPNALIGQVCPIRCLKINEG